MAQYGPLLSCVTRIDDQHALYEDKTIFINNVLNQEQRSKNGAGREVDS